MNVGVMIGLALGNFTWQAATERLWMVAAERSWFQLVAVLAYALVARYLGAEVSD